MHVLQSRNHVMVCNASNSATLDRYSSNGNLIPIRRSLTRKWQVG